MITKQLYDVQVYRGDIALGTIKRMGVNSGGSVTNFHERKRPNKADTSSHELGDPNDLFLTQDSIELSVLKKKKKECLNGVLYKEHQRSYSPVRFHGASLPLNVMQPISPNTPVCH